MAASWSPSVRPIRQLEIRDLQYFLPLSVRYSGTADGRKRFIEDAEEKLFINILKIRILFSINYCLTNATKLHNVPESAIITTLSLQKLLVLMTLILLQSINQSTRFYFRQKMSTVNR